MEIKVHIEHEPDFRGTAIYLYGSDPQGEFIIEPVELVRRDFVPGEPNYTPTFRFTGRDGTAFLQSLVQALVQIGFKPNEIKASEGTLEATKYHLEDMRKLVLGK